VGGSTWISPLAGWVLGEGKAGCSTCVIIKYTDDGGRTWTMSDPAGRTLLSGGSTYTCQNSGGCVTHLVFVNRDDGYLFGPDLFTTTNGGRTWNRQRESRPLLWRQSRQGWSGDSPTMKMAVRDHVLTLQQQRTGTTSW